MAPLTPRGASAALERGEADIELQLKVDPPTVDRSGNLKGGDAGLSLVAAALQKTKAGAVQLEVVANAKPHHITSLADKLQASPPAEPARVLRLTLRDGEVLSFDRAGKVPDWNALLLGPSSFRVEHLDISGSDMENAVGPMVYLEPVSKSAHLTSFAMRHIGEHIPADEQPAFSAGLEAVLRNTNLADIDLTHNSLGDLYPDVVASLSGGLTHFSSLKLSWNSLHHDGKLNLQFVPTILGAADNRLHTLHLGRNDLGAEGGEVIADAIKTGHVAHLKDLELNDNDLGAGAVRVVDALVEKRGECALEHLGLHGNAGGASIAHAAARLLKSEGARDLRSLDLSSNGIADAGLKAVLRALLDGAAPSLQDLNVSGDRFALSPEMLQVAMRRGGVNVNYYESLGGGARKEIAALRDAPARGTLLAGYAPVYSGEDVYPSVKAYLESLAGAESKTVDTRAVSAAIALAAYLHPTVRAELVRLRGKFSDAEMASFRAGLPDFVAEAFAGVLASGELFGREMLYHVRRNLNACFLESVTVRFVAVGDHISYLIEHIGDYAVLSTATSSKGPFRPAVEVEVCLACDGCDSGIKQTTR
ncbi:RAN GTPase-activating protein 1 [Diplonema papillatum]|nr:RAN GTPase-activating protein 1 [Diplonema papillatum]